MSSIQQLSSAHLAEVMDLIRKAVAEMESHRIFQWDEIYPDEEKIKTDLLSGAMYGWMNQSIVCAVIVLNEIQSPLYQQINWKYNKTPALVIHRLCVHPAYQQKGIARKFVLFAEQYGREHQYESIRLDAFVHNPFAEKIYRTMGYEERGIITFRKGDFYCFEKKLDSVSPLNVLS